MTDDFLAQLKALEFDSLTAKQAVELRALLNDAVAKSDRWFSGLARDFSAPAKLGNGRPPVIEPNDKASSPPVKSPKKRGRPVPDLKVNFKTRRPPPAPLAVGGADSAGTAPQPAQLFQDSYVSKDGPRPGATLPPDHPRRAQMRESSVTPEVDMSDFAEAERAMKGGGVGKMFQ